jgi:hypothetical protein
MDFQTEVRQNIEKEMDIIEKSLGYLSNSTRKQDDIVLETTSDFQAEMNESNHKYWSDMLKSSAQIEKKMTFIGPKDSQTNYLIWELGELRMEFLINTQKLQIISNENIAHFLNEENHGQVILTYLISRFFHELHWPHLPFLNLNLRQSLQESPEKNGMEDLLTRQSAFLIHLQSPCM